VRWVGIDYYVPGWLVRKEFGDGFVGGYGGGSRRLVLGVDRSGMAGVDQG
jgi:hypothetical protein